MLEERSSGIRIPSGLRFGGRGGWKAVINITSKKGVTHG